MLSKAALLTVALLHYCAPVFGFATLTHSHQIMESLTRLHYHPAVEGWREKYVDAGGGAANAGDGTQRGPRIVSESFDVRRATSDEIEDLDVYCWPTWTTSDKEKWSVGNKVVGKVMPYGELSYLLSGQLEIIPDGGEPVVIKKGDLVTFPRDFKASWCVLEELTWHYYLY
mmetsp:Transcript_30591/g.69114  ORF Transcript_30591/g.69114 Transcript_30591/m.69114 type:complete len:171 (-) Transcript_30591:57-569(-)